MIADVLSRFDPKIPSLVHSLYSYTLYFNPSWIAPMYPARVGGILLTAAQSALVTQQKILDRVISEDSMPMVCVSLCSRVLFLHNCSGPL
jgi:hypothetical protein